MKIGMWSGIKICKKKIVDIFFHSEMRHAGTCERTRAHGPDLYVNTRSQNALARPHAQISTGYILHKWSDCLYIACLLE